MERQPFERFAAMIQRHWEGIAAYCLNKVASGFVERPNSKIRVIQRRAWSVSNENGTVGEFSIEPAPGVPVTASARPRWSTPA